MKKVITILAAILLAAVAATAQNPKLSYSAVVRNSANELVANQTVTVAVSIANSETGTAVYSETHSNVQTNQNGLLTLTIGDGTVEDGDLAAVEWNTAYITTQYTLPDGSLLVSTMPVNAVPYALYAENAGNSTQVNADWEATSGAAEILHKPTIPIVNNGTLTITLPDGTSKTFTANQDGDTEVNIPAPTPMTAQDLIDLVNGMTDEQKEALKEALGLTGGGEEPGGEEPAEFTCGDNLIIGENSYPTVQIGTQCWTKTNLREAVGTNGTDLTDDNYSYTEPFYYVNPNVDATVYGYYYNWPAANQVCPEGWHLPDTTEWNTMQVYVSTAKDAYGNYMYRCEGDSTYIAQALATDGDYWYRGDVSESYPCEPEYDLTKNNKTGFSAVPAGYWYHWFDNAGGAANFWSSPEAGTDDAWHRGLGYDYEYVYRYINSRDLGFSVRCVRD